MSRAETDDYDYDTILSLVFFLKRRLDTLHSFLLSHISLYRANIPPPPSFVSYISFSSQFRASIGAMPLVSHTVTCIVNQNLRRMASL